MNAEIDRKNLLIILMSIELLLLAVNINFVAFSSFLGDLGGQVFVFESGKLTARQVDVVEVSGNALQVTGALQPGEIIATAGISLLYDGMPARLLDPAKLR